MSDFLRDALIAPGFSGSVDETLAVLNTPEATFGIQDFAQAIAQRDIEIKLARRSAFVGRGLRFRVNAYEQIIDPDMVEMRARQITGAAMLLHSETNRLLAEKRGGIMSMTGTMGAGKSTGLIMYAHWQQAAARDIRVVTNPNEISRYEPRGILSSGLAQNYVLDSAIPVHTVGEGGSLSDQDLLDSMRPGEVMVMFETIFAISPDTVKAVMDKAEEIGSVVVFDNLLRLASGDIHPSVIASTQRADRVVILPGVDAFHTDSFASTHVFFNANWSDEGKSLEITQCPPPHEPIVSMAISAEFQQKSPDEGLLLWTTTRQTLGEICLVTGHDTSQVLRKLNASDRFYGDAIKDGRAIFLPSALGFPVGKYSDFANMLSY